MSALDIFKAGTHVDMSGKRLTFGPEDLKASVESYDPALFQAPLVVGHPQLNNPAYGWVQSLSLDGDLMRAEPERVEAQFAEMVNDGRFPKVSASFFHPDSPSNPVPGVWYLRHVGFLGAQAPAVKGLKPAQFAGDDSDVVTVEFSAPWRGGRALTRLLRGFREWLIEDRDTETADRVMPDYLIESIAEADRETPAQFAAPDPDSPTEETPMDPMQQQTAEFAERETALQTREAALAERERQLEEQEKQKRTADIASFADQLINDGKVLPRDKDGLVAFMAGLDDADTVSFADGGQTVSKPSGTWLREFLGGLPQQVDFAEHSAPEADATQQSASFAAPQGYIVDAERLALHNNALAYKAKHNVDYDTALAAVS